MREKKSTNLISRCPVVARIQMKWPTFCFSRSRIEPNDAMARIANPCHDKHWFQEERWHSQVQNSMRQKWSGLFGDRLNCGWLSPEVNSPLLPLSLSLALAKAQANTAQPKNWLVLSSSVSHSYSTRRGDDCRWRTWTVSINWLKWVTSVTRKLCKYITLSADVCVCLCVFLSTINMQH